MSPREFEIMEMNLRRWKPGGRFYFWKHLPTALRLMFKYRRYVLVATDIQNEGGEFRIESCYSGLTPDGFKHILQTAFEYDDAGERLVKDAKRITGAPNDPL